MRRVFNEDKKILQKELPNLDLKIGDMIMLTDEVCPTLIRRLKNNEMATLYPIRGIIIYADTMMAEHTRLVHGFFIL